MKTVQAGLQSASLRTFHKLKLKTLCHQSFNAFTLPIMKHPSNSSASLPSARKQAKHQNRSNQREVSPTPSIKLAKVLLAILQGSARLNSAWGKQGEILFATGRQRVPLASSFKSICCKFKCLINNRVEGKYWNRPPIWTLANLHLGATAEYEWAQTETWPHFIFNTWLSKRR